MTGGRRLSGRSAVVTGAASGIGAAIAERFVRDGAVVTIADLDGAKAELTADRLRGGGATVRAVEADVTDRDAVVAMIAAAVDEHGALDVLVNNVGVARETPFETMSDDDWTFQIEVTLTSTFRCIQAAIDHLARSTHGGRIINIGSVNGLYPFGHEAYSAAKAGLVNLTQNLALRYGAKGIRVNLVAPGPIQTEAWAERVAVDPTLLDRIRSLTALGTFGEPEDVAAACAFLASDEAQWITGAVLPVDGGLGGGSLAMMRARQLATPKDGSVE